MHFLLYPKISTVLMAKIHLRSIFNYSPCGYAAVRFSRIMQPGITLSASGVSRSVRDVHANFTCHGQICAHKLRLFQRFEIFHGLILTKLSHALRWASLEISTKASFNQRSTDSARVLINSVLLSEQYCSPFRLSIAHALIHTMHGYILLYVQ